MPHRVWSMPAQGVIEAPRSWYTGPLLAATEHARLTHAVGTRVALCG
jgi:hypothetical protein